MNKADTYRLRTISNEEILSDMDKTVPQNTKRAKQFVPNFNPCSNRLFSPSTVISKKKAHSFEMANLLTSLLLGRNYNAYNVYGFATKDVTQRIMCRVDCPFDEPEKQEEEVVEEEAPSKYALRPRRDLRSKFLQAMEQKEIDKARKLKEKELQIRKEEQAELEKPPPDELHGKRIHGWVLMMPRDDKDEMKPFFIEATTGFSHDLDSPLYCSIQSVWNNTNYWVNLQDDSLGVGNLDFNVNNIEHWEHILPGEPIQWRVHPKIMEMEDDEEAMQLRLIMDEKHLDMPEPWSLRINVPYHDVVTRFPSGRKTTMYKRTIVEQYSPYALQDGLVMRIYKYTDLECTDLISIEERFENRCDKLIKRTEDCATLLITEYFDRGRDDNAKQHDFYKNDNEKESWRKIEFYAKSRYDGMELLDHNPTSLTEHYIDREDKFYYRHVTYAKRGEPPPGFLEGPRRIIMYVIEKFKRSPDKKASEDIAIREFDYIGLEMHLKFHYDTGKITASTRTFIKPPLTEMVEGVSFHPELTYGYQAEIGAKPIKNSTLYVLLQQQIIEEEECNIKIKYIEDGVAEFVKIRAFEMAHPKLDIGLFNREQNKNHRIDMLEKERFERTKKEREIEDDLDFIKPYMVRFNCETKMRSSQALRVREACLNEFKDLLVWRANNLQKQFQDQMEYIKKKREWYNEQSDYLQFEDQQDYFREMSDANYVQHVLELRLIRQKELAPSRFESLIRFLNLHPKLQKLPPLKTSNF